MTTLDEKGLACPYCEGLGKYERGPTNMNSWDDEPDYEEVTCPHCEGKGKVVAAACPHCESIDLFVERADTSSAYVMCNDCGARGPVECQIDDIEAEPGGINAIAAWNRRAPAQSINAEMLEALRLARSQIDDFETDDSTLKLIDDAIARAEAATDAGGDA